MYSEAVVLYPLVHHDQVSTSLILPLLMPRAALRHLDLPPQRLFSMRESLEHVVREEQTAQRRQLVVHLTVDRNQPDGGAFQKRNCLSMSSLGLERISDA